MGARVQAGGGPNNSVPTTAISPNGHRGTTYGGHGGRNARIMSEHPQTILRSSAQNEAPTRRKRQSTVDLDSASDLEGEAHSKSSGAFGGGYNKDNQIEVPEDWGSLPSSK